MKIELLKKLIINRFEKFDFVVSITPVGRHYNDRKNNYSNVNDIDIHLLVQKKDKTTCGVLLHSCNKIIESNKDISCGIVDGPYKPQETSGKKIFYFHLLVDDIETLKKRSYSSYPTIYSWSKYKPIYGKNFIINYVNRKLNLNDVLLSRFGLFNCLEFIEQGFVDMNYYSALEMDFRILKYKLENYYGVYFQFYSIMQQIRNIQRLHGYDIEFMDDNSVVKSFLENFDFTRENELTDIISSMNSIRQNGYNSSSIDFQNLRKKTIQALKNMTGVIEIKYV